MDYERRPKAAAAPLSSAQSRKILEDVAQMLGILQHGGVARGGAFVPSMSDDMDADQLREARKGIDDQLEATTKVLFGLHHPDAKDLVQSAVRHMQMAKKAVGGDETREELYFSEMSVREAIKVLTMYPDRGELFDILAATVNRIVPKDAYLEQNYHRAWELATKLAQTESNPKKKAWLEGLAAGAKQCEEAVDALTRAAAFSHRMLPKVKNASSNAGLRRVLQNFGLMARTLAHGGYSDRGQIEALRHNSTYDEIIFARGATAKMIEGVEKALPDVQSEEARRQLDRALRELREVRRMQDGAKMAEALSNVALNFGIAVQELD